ncbi:hypothetical protein Ahia01_001333600 [Argonauta hians]
MVSVAIQSLTDEQLRCTLTDHHVTVGPITKSTRKIYERKLARLRKELPALKLGDNNSEEEPTATEEAEMEVEEEMEDEEEVVVEKIPVVTRQYSTPKTQIGTPFITSGYSHSASRSQVGTPYVSSGLSRRPLNTNTNYYQDNKTYTSLRKQETSSSSSSSAATAAKKSGMSWFSKLLVMVLLGLVLWMVYLNFDPEMPKE